MTVLTANVRVEDLPRRYLVYVRNIGPYMGNPSLFETLFNKVFEWGKPRGLFTDPKTEAISIYHDDPESVPQEEQRISVGFTVPDKVEVSNEIELLEIPAGKYAVGTYEILPDQYGEAWEDIFQFIGRQRLFPASGPMYESNKNDPHAHPEGRHLVDICVALK